MQPPSLAFFCFASIPFLRSKNFYGQGSFLFVGLGAFQIEKGDVSDPAFGVPRRVARGRGHPWKKAVREDDFSRISVRTEITERSEMPDVSEGTEKNERKKGRLLRAGLWLRPLAHLRLLQQSQNRP